jgi:glycosyltransferase involved in cell wall biosynthesis
MKPIQSNGEASLKVLMMIAARPGSGLGGVRRTAINTAMALGSVGIEVIVLCNAEDYFLDLLRDRGLDARYFPFPAAGPRAHWRRKERREISDQLAKLANEAEISILHLEDPYLMDYVGAVHAKKVLSQYAATPEPRRLGIFDNGFSLRPRRIIGGWYRKYVRLNYRQANLVICNSDAAMQDALITYGVDFERAVLVHPGSEPTMHVAEYGAIRSEFGVSKNARVALMVGRITRAKGIEDFGQVARLLSARNSDYRFLIAGDAREPEYLERMKSEYGRYVTFLDARSDMGNVFADADVLVHLSHREAGPVAVIESFEYGLPVIAWNIPGLTHLVTNDEGGFLLDFGDSTGVADSIERIFEDPELRTRMQRAAKKRYEGFTLETYGRNLERAYRSVL